MPVTAQFNHLSVVDSSTAIKKTTTQQCDADKKIYFQVNFIYVLLFLFNNYRSSVVHHATN